MQAFFERLFREIAAASHPARIGLDPATVAPSSGLPT